MKARRPAGPRQAGAIQARDGGSPVDARGPEYTTRVERAEWQEDGQAVSMISAAASTNRPKNSREPTEISLLSESIALTYDKHTPWIAGQRPLSAGRNSFRAGADSGIPILTATLSGLCLGEGGGLRPEAGLDRPRSAGDLIGRHRGALIPRRCGGREHFARVDERFGDHTAVVVGV